MTNNKNSRNCKDQHYNSKYFIENKDRFLMLPIILFECPVINEFEKGDYIVIKCCTNPKKVDWPSFNLSILGIPEQYIKLILKYCKDDVDQQCFSSTEKCECLKEY